MIFSRTIYSAILVGIVTGVLLSCMQVLSLNPIIFAAESFEVAEVTDSTAAHSGHSRDHGHGHSHGGDEWAPADGFERTAYTFFANILASIGFAAVLLSLMCQFWLGRNRDISWGQAALWGLAGYLAVYVAPAIGLPPEIPGAVAAAVEHRQLWWVLAVASIAVGFLVLAFAPVKFKLLGLLSLPIPYLIAAPQEQGPMFPHPDPEAVIALTELHQQFVVLGAGVNLVFWLLLGMACRLAFNRWFRRIPVNDEYAHA